MATAKFIDSPDFELTLRQVSESAPKTVDKALKAGAAVIADEMRKRLLRVLSEKATGDLMDGFGITPVKRDSDGTANVHIGFEGYNRERVPNQLTARVMESGAKYKNGAVRKARPFARPAVAATKEKAYRVMRDVVETEFNKLSKK